MEGHRRFDKYPYVLARLHDTSRNLNQLRSWLITCPKVHHFHSTPIIYILHIFKFNSRPHAYVAIRMRLATILAIFGATYAVALLEDTGPSVEKMGLCFKKCGSDLDCQTYCLTVSN
jgi:hypothetical protein